MHTSTAVVVIRLVRDSVSDHQPQLVRTGFVLQRSRGLAYDGDTLDHSMSKCDCRWSVVLQLNFNLLTVLTCVCR
jgi:hypothetical protein